MTAISSPLRIRRGARVRALASLAPHLLPAQRSKTVEQALAVAMVFGSDQNRATALGSLAPYVPPNQYNTFVNSVTDIAARLPRSKALEAATASVHISAALGGAQGLAEIRRAIMDTARWYP
jgi:hypothetical protein